MSRHWTFGQKLGLGFAITVLLTVALGLVAILTLRSVVASKDHVITHDAHLLLQAERVAAFVVEELADVCGTPQSTTPCAASLVSSR